MHIFEKLKNRALEASFEQVHAKGLRFWSINKKTQKESLKKLQFSKNTKGPEIRHGCKNAYF
jgi:hypothetical protein